MGYNISPNQKFTFQKGQFSHQWKYLIHTIMQCMSPKSTGFNEFSSNIATALVCLATNWIYNFSKMIFDGLVKNVNNKGEGSSTPTEPHHTPSPAAQPTSHTTYSSSTLPPVTTTSIPTVTPSDSTPIRQYTQRAMIAQSFDLLTVVDDPESPLRDISQWEACPTDSGFIADQDRETIAKSSTLPHDSAPRVTSLVAAEGTQEIEITRLKARVKHLEDTQGVAAEGIGDDAPIKGRNLDEGEAAAERASDDTEEMATVLMSMDAATVLASGAAEVPTGSGSIPTVGPPAAEVPTGSDVVPTASLVFATTTVVTPYRRRKGKEVMVELPKSWKSNWKERIREVEWKLYDSCGVHHVTSKDKKIFMLVEKDYPLRKGLALVMISYKLQVENYSHMANDLILKIYKIANSPRQQEEVPTASEEGCHCQKKRKATARKIALLSKSRRNCQSKSNDSFTKSTKSQFRSVFVVSQGPQNDYAPMVQHSLEYSPPETGLVVPVFQKGMILLTRSII
nr:synaptobrevin, longin-like domain protein [Tanacetum cinerariifolium]